MPLSEIHSVSFWTLDLANRKSVLLHFMIILGIQRQQEGLEFYRVIEYKWQFIIICSLVSIVMLIKFNDEGRKPIKANKDASLQLGDSFGPLID